MWHFVYYFPILFLACSASASAVDWIPASSGQEWRGENGGGAATKKSKDKNKKATTAQREGRLEQTPIKERGVEEGEKVRQQNRCR